MAHFLKVMMRESLDFHGDCKMYTGQQNCKTLMGMKC